MCVAYQILDKHQLHIVNTNSNIKFNDSSPIDSQDLPIAKLIYNFQGIKEQNNLQTAKLSKSALWMLPGQSVISTSSTTGKKGIIHFLIYGSFSARPPNCPANCVCCVGLCNVYLHTIGVVFANGTIYHWPTKKWQLQILVAFNVGHKQRARGCSHRQTNTHSRVDIFYIVYVMLCLCI